MNLRTTRDTVSKHERNVISRECSSVIFMKRVTRNYIEIVRFQEHGRECGISVLNRSSIEVENGQIEF